MRLAQWFFLLWITFVLVGCGGGGSEEVFSGGTQQDSRADFSALRSIPVGAIQPIVIPTYDGSNQVVHPDIIIKNGEFKLVITPYPWSHVEYENPSYYVSRDGINFVPGTHNPIVDHPKNGYNDDPDLIYDDANKIYRIYYNDTPHPSKTTWNRQYLSVLSSFDGVHWTDSVHLLQFNFGAGDPFIVSPSLIKAFGNYFLFHVQIDNANDHFCGVSDPHKHHIGVYISQDGLHWAAKSAQPIAMDAPVNFNPWHINIIDDHKGTYYMLVNGYEGSFCHNHKLYIATSHDLAHWHFVPTPIVVPQELPKGQIVYRSAGLIDGDHLYLYVSYKTTDNRWFLVVKHLLLSQIIH